MAKNSLIEWTDATWNPWMGCTKISAGCKNCYMFRDQERYGNDPTEIRKSKTTFRDPLNWDEPKMIFVCSWSDFFHEDIPEDWRREAWEIMYHAKGQGHTFLLLTKRPENIINMLPVGWIEGMWKRWPHIWLGVTAENQKQANLRIPKLLDIPAAKYFVSIEPMLSPIRLGLSMLGGVCFEHDGTPWPSLDWIIVGGESGPGFRPMKKEWALDIRDQCIAADIPFFFKQWDGIRPKNDPRGMMLDGKIWNEFPLRKESE